MQYKEKELRFWAQVGADLDSGLACALDFMQVTWILRDCFLRDINSHCTVLVSGLNKQLLPTKCQHNAWSILSPNPQELLRTEYFQTAILSKGKTPVNLIQMDFFGGVGGMSSTHRASFQRKYNWRCDFPF